MDVEINYEDCVCAVGKHAHWDDVTLLFGQENQLLLGDLQLVDLVAWKAAVELGRESCADSLESCGQSSVADDQVADGLDVLSLVDVFVDHVFDLLR